MYKVIKDLIADYNVDKCNETLGFNNYDGQRNLMINRLNELKKKMKENKFHGCDVAFGILDGVKYLVNGQHSLTAAVETKTPIKVREKTFVCQEKEDLSNLYAQFDVGGGRTSTHIAKAYAASLDGDWPARCITVCGSAISYIKYGQEYFQKTLKDERMQNAINDIKSCEFVKNTIYRNGGKDKHRHLNKVPVVAAMIQSFKVDDEKAKKFWDLVRDGECLNKEHPAYVLREWLLRVSGSHNAKTKEVVSTAEIRVKCLQAWVAFYNGKPSVKLKFTHNMLVNNIFPSPY